MREEEIEVGGLVKKITGVVAGLFFLAVVLSSWVNIPAGHVGVVFDKTAGGVQKENLREGWHFRMPLKTYVRAYPVGMRTFSDIGIGDGVGDEKQSPLISLPTAGGQHIDQQISIVYHVNPNEANSVFDKFQGADIEEIEANFIRRNVQSVATAVSGSYDLMAALGPAKKEIQGKIQAALSEKLAPYGFILDQVNLGYAKAPEAIEQSLQAKMKAEQEADGAKYAKQKAEMDAQSSIARAEGEAKANALVRQQLSAEFLQYQEILVRQEAVKKWNGTLPTQMIPGAALPFIDVGLKR